jgi:biopolymer transport protein ExbD
MASEVNPHARCRRATSAKRRSSACRALALGALLSACSTTQPADRVASLALPTPPSAEVSTSPKRPGTTPARPRVAVPKGAFDEIEGFLRISALGTGEVYVGEAKARDDRELEAMLEALAPTKRTRAVVLEVDRDLLYARVVELMDLLRNAGYDEVNLATSIVPLASPSPP